MKKIILIINIFLICIGCSRNEQQKEKTIIPDGFYQVVKSGTASTDFGSLGNAELLVDADKEFMKNDLQDFTKAVIDVSQYVPLELEKLPVTREQAGLNKSLMISLAPEAAKKMKDFTEKRIMQQVAIVMDGKILTMHKVRAVISGGEVQIISCDDNACEYLLVKMKDKVKN